MRIIKILLLLFSASLILLPLGILFAITEEAPLARQPLPVTPEVALRVKQLAQQFQRGTYFRHGYTMSLSAADIDKLFAVASRAIPRLSGDARVSERGSEIRMTFHLPENPFGDYINLRLVLPLFSAHGLKIDEMAIGNLILTGDNAYALLEGAANLAFGGDEGSRLLQTIKQVRNSRELLIVTYQPTPHIDEKLVAALRRLQPWREGLTSADRDATRYYYTQLCERYRGMRTVALGEALSSAYLLAAQRSDSTEGASRENRAVLLALAILIGNDRFNTFINAIDDTTVKRCRRRVPAATLAGRRDLALHFIYSAAIKILSDSHMSFAVGEMKEMMDSLQGGSGFSFVDLSADESGIRFAEVATAPDRSRMLQSSAAALVDESSFMPRTDDLPEGIPQQLFDREYGGSNGEYYKEKLDQIRSRLDAIALYRPQ